MTTSKRPRKPRPFVVQFASDLHHEFEHCTADHLRLPVDPHADVLILAGGIHDNISELNPSIRDLASQVPVVMVAGNHEFYCHEFGTHRKALADWARTIPNFHFLDNGSTTIRGVRIVGATFWSNFDNGNPRLIADARHMMTDYSVIADDTTTVGSLTTNFGLNREDKQQTH